MRGKSDQLRKFPARVALLSTQITVRILRTGLRSWEILKTAVEKTEEQMDGLSFVAQGELSYLYSNATLKGHLCRDPKNLV